MGTMQKCASLGRPDTWRWAQPVRLVDRKPEESDCMSGSKRASPVQCCVTAPTSTHPAFGLSLPQLASLVGSVPPVVDAAPQLPHRFECLPARDHCGESDPRRGGEMVDFGVHHLPLPGGAPAPKKWGSLSPPAPLQYGAPLRRAGGTPARHSLASHCRSRRGEYVPTRFQ